MTLRTLALLGVLAVPHPGLAGGTGTRGPGFTISVRAPSTSRAGVSGQLSIAITPSDGRKINEEYPLKIKVSGPSDVEFPTVHLGPGDARRLDAKRVEVPVEFMAKAAGDKRVSLELRFAVCTSSACEPQRETLMLRLHVE